MVFSNILAIPDAGLVQETERGAHVKIIQGQIRACFAFDIGYEVKLDLLQKIAAVTPVPPISRKKQTTLPSIYRTTTDTLTRANR